MMAGSATLPTPTPIMIASARLHLETAIGLVGKEQVQTWLIETNNTFTLNAKTIHRTVASATTTGQRGRKAGIIPATGERCVWKLTNGEQCSNKKKEGATLCGLHVGKAHLLSGASSVVSTGAASPGASDIPVSDACDCDV